MLLCTVKWMGIMMMLNLSLKSVFYNYAADLQNLEGLIYTVFNKGATLL